MANFYTYGIMPSAEETVYGFQDFESYGDSSFAPGLGAFNPEPEARDYIPQMDDFSPIDYGFQERERLAAEEAERFRVAEALRQAEMERQLQEAIRQEAARQEMMRQEMMRQEMARQEAARQEAARQEAIRQEQIRQVQMERDAERQRVAQMEAMRQAEAARVAQAQRIAEEARQAEAARIEQERQAQIARQAELDRIAQQEAARRQQEEAARVAAEQEAARRAAEERVNVPREESVPIAPLNEAPSPQPSFVNFLRQQGIDVTPPPPAPIVGGPVVPPEDRIPAPTGNNEFISPLAPAFTEPPSYTPRGESEIITPQAPPSPLTLVSGGEGLLSPEEPRVYNPRGENVPVSPLAAPTGSRVVPPEGFPFGTKGSMYVPGSTIPEGVDPLAPIEYTEEQGKAASNALALASLIAPGSFGNMYVGDAAFGGAPISTAEYYRNVASDSVGGQGSLYEEGALEAAKAAAKDPYSSLWGASLKELVAQDPSLQPMVDAKVARELDRIAKVEQDYEQMKPLSDLLKANKFQEAFAYAKEQGIADRLLKADWLSQLRQPFTDEEQQQFYNAIPPDLVGKGWIFDPANAMKRSFTAKGTTPQWMGYPDPGAAFKPKENKSFEKIAMAAGLAMLGAAYLPGLAGAGGAKAAAGAGAGAGAGGAGAGAGAGVGGLSYFKPAGLLAGTTAAKAVPIAATITATGGGLTAAQLAALGAAGVGAGAVSGGGAGAGAGTAPATTTTPVDPLQEVVVTGTRAAPSVVPGLVAGAGTAAAAGGAGGAGAAPATTTTPVEPLEEVVVTGTRAAPSVVPGLVAGAGTAAASGGAGGAPATTTSPVEPLEEVVVKGSKLKPIDITAGALIPPLSQMLPQGSFGQPQTIKEPTATEKQLDEIQDALKKGTPIPGATSPLDQFRNLINRLGGIQNLVKVLGSLGAGASAGRKAAAPGAGVGAGGMGGALPKFELKRTEFKPPIDYYTYGTRPEEKFFEYQMSPVEQAAPETGVVPPKDRPPVFKDGGLSAYSKGGSNKSRYFDGPGSGRDDKIPALLSDGEYVMDAETLALLGDGSTKEGARRMDKFRANIRQHKGRALSRGRISPNAKSPEEHMGGGLT